MLDQQQATKTPNFEAALMPTDPSPTLATEATFQGESSFDSHSAQASLSAEVSARDAQGGNLGQKINTSLSSLKSLLRNQGRSSSADDLTFPHSSVKSTQPRLELPPIPAVLAALKRAAGKILYQLQILKLKLHSAHPICPPSQCSKRSFDLRRSMQEGLLSNFNILERGNYSHEWDALVCICRVLCKS